MSALLNHNEIPYIPWKSTTFQQLTSTIQKNQNLEGNDGDNYFRAGPLKIYRREIAANIPENASCSRISSSIDELTRPNGYVVSNAGEGLVNTLNAKDMNIANSLTETNKCPDAISSKTAIPCNALRRCRSSGMITRKFDPARNDYTYFTNTNQYLVSRSKTFKQNQYAQVRYADPSLLPNPSNSGDKFYSPNGLSHCPKTYYDGIANPFSYIWIDGNTYTVSIPAGYYDVHDLNAAFQLAMTNNGHYLISLMSNSYVFLLKIVYNNYYNKVELQVYSTANYPISNYIVPTGATWTIHSPDTVPQFVIDDNGFQNVVGFTHASYPADASTHPTQNQGFVSNMQNAVFPSYTLVSYKPNNPRFAQQGGASGSSLIQRKKYDTIQTVASSYNNVFGSQVANAMAYGVSEQVYTLKSRLGYPGKKTPVFPKYGEPKCVLNSCATTYPQFAI